MISQVEIPDTFSAEQSRTEMSSETIAGHGDLINGFAPSQPWASAGP